MIVRRLMPRLRSRTGLHFSGLPGTETHMKLYVGNLSFDTNEGRLQELFGAHGNVQSTAVITDRETGRSRGFVFVEMDNEGAPSAMAAMDGQNVDGRDLQVNEAKPRNDSRGGGGGGGGRRGGW